MNSLILAGILALGVGSSAIPNATQNEIIVKTSTENLTNIQRHNNNSSISKDKKSLALFEEYGVDANEASNSMDVYIQEEYVEFDEIILTEYLTNELGISTLDLGSSYTQEYTHNKGYIKFTTKAYALGFYDNNIVYHVEVTTEQQKRFIVNQNDNLIIRHGDNSATLNLVNYPATGTRLIPYTLKNDNTTYYDEETLTADYSCADAGVYYTFRTRGSSYTDSLSSVTVGNSIVTADYYMVATDTTEVQPVYVHNYDWFVESLDISFGPIGTSFSIPNSDDVMEGTTMTLKGYDSAISRQTYTLNPEDWEFDARYYFKNEGIKTKTITVDDLTITTKRLRCGYIEEEYINLSPNRYNAGDAYLELSFNKPIYEMDVYISFWSKYENLSSDGDYAYIQYLNEDDEWITYVDLLSAGISTDRTSQTFIECDIIEGTYGIKFVSHKETPDTDRNMGRISIGSIKFITNYID